MSVQHVGDKDLSTGNGAAVRPRRRLHELDLLRFVAAMAVVAYHATGGGTRDWQRAGVARPFPEISPATHWGYLGVQLFFLISGFVILMSAWNRPPEMFAVSRFTRLFPAYWFSLLLAVALFLLTRQSVDYGPGGEGVLRRFLPNLTMLQDAVGSRGMELSYWTLWVELRFYLLVGLLLWWGLTVRRVLLFMGGWLLISVMAQEANSSVLREIFLPDWAPYFIAGMAFYLIYRYGSNLVCWLLAGFCWALATYYATQRIDPINAWPGVQNYMIPAIVTALFAVMALVAVGGLGRLRWRGLAVLGALTYPVYLLHEMIMIVAIRYLYPRLTPWGVLGIATGTILVLAYLVHRLVERPARSRLEHHLRAAIANLREAAPPPATEDSGPPDSEPPADSANGARGDSNPPIEVSPSAP
jgi:peptidoglycan/LPS O-acetylase OafA/YrhL